jgi:hypothetical protein|tara:strand:+ start:1450 stop:2034 length:585 start_codon:yes stop_codon:yes gene_type:complete
MSKTLTSSLLSVQSELKAPKNQRNNFGKYNYRSAEDILEAVKPLLSTNGLSMHITDEVLEVGGIVFINATVVVSDGTDSVYASAQAGVDANRKGMDIAQSFGSSSSYARKYAMNGMFLIDDTKDADATNTHGSSSAPSSKPTADADSEWFSKSIDYIKNAKNGSAKQLAYKQVLTKYGERASDNQKKALLKFVG